MRILPGLIAMLLTASAAHADSAPPMPGTIVVESASDPADPPENAALFTDAVEDALLDARFLPLSTVYHSRYVAHITVTREIRGLATGKVAVAGPQASVGNWGGAVTVALPSKKRAIHDLVQTQLRVDIMLRSTGRPVWSGSALTIQAEGDMGSSPATASKLANAVVRQFPGGIGTPISVP